MNKGSVDIYFSNHPLSDSLRDILYYISLYAKTKCYVISEYALEDLGIIGDSDTLILNFDGIFNVFTEELIGENPKFKDEHEGIALLAKTIAVKERRDVVIVMEDGKQADLFKKDYQPIIMKRLKELNLGYINVDVLDIPSARNLMLYLDESFKNDPDKTKS